MLVVYLPHRVASFFFSTTEPLNSSSLYDHVAAGQMPKLSSANFLNKDRVSARSAKRCGLCFNRSAAEGADEDSHP